MTLQKITVAYVLFLVITVTILDFELLPTPREIVRQYAPNIVVARHYPQKFFLYEDKVAHFFLIGALAFLLSLSLPGSRKSWRNIVTVNLILLLLVTVEEGSQAWFPSRSSSWSDLLANYAGIFFFGWAAGYVDRHRDILEPKLPAIVANLIWEPQTKNLRRYPRGGLEPSQRCYRRSAEVFE